MSEDAIEPEVSVAQTSEDVAPAPAAATAETKPAETIPCPLSLEQYFRKIAVSEDAPAFMAVAAKNAAGDIILTIHPDDDTKMARQFAIIGETAVNVTRLPA